MSASNIISVIWLFIITVSSAFGIPTMWESRGPGGGGALYTPSINPYNSSEYFIQCDMSEMFHSTNAGLTWETLDFRQTQGQHLSEVKFGAISNLCYTISDLDIQYHPARSSDGGRTWSAFPTNTWPSARTAFSIFPSPADTNQIIIGSQSNLYFSADGGLTFTSLYFYTGGQAPAGSLAGLRLAGAFWDGSNIFVGANAGLLVSTNAGQSFTNATVDGISTNEAIFSFVGAKQNGTTRFFCVTMKPNMAYLDTIIKSSYGPTKFRSVYMLDWGQTNWVPSITGLNTNEERYSMVVMARDDITTAYLSAGNTNLYPNTRIYKTTDGGSNWFSVLVVSNQNLYTGLAGFWAAGQLISPVNMDVPEGFTIDATNANHVIFSECFAHVTTDGGATWRQIYVDPAYQHATNVLIAYTNTYRGNGLEPTRGVWMLWTSPSNLLIGDSDIRLTKSDDGGATWGFNYTGVASWDECYHIVRHPASGALYADFTHILSPYMTMGVDTQSTDSSTGLLAFSTNNGTTWATLHDFGGLPPVWEALDPNDPNRLFVSIMNTTTGGVYMTTNLNLGTNANWTSLPQPAHTNGMTANGRANNLRLLNDGTLVASFSCLTKANIFEASSGVFVTTNHGVNWDDRSDSNMFWWTQDVVIDPWDSGQSNWVAGVWLAWGIPYATSRIGLYRTTDRGHTWTHIFTNDSVYSAAFSPVNSNELYVVSTLNGLWHSDDIRSATPTFTQVAGYPFREPLRVFYNPYNSNEVWILSNGNGTRVGVYSNWTIAVTAGPHGTNSPIGPLSVYDGMPASLAFQAEPYYHIASLLTNGVSAGAEGATAKTLTWERVTADMTIAVTYAEDHAAAPTGLTATDGAYTDKVALAWNAVTNANGYIVYRSVSAATNTAVSIDISIATNYDDHATGNGTNYYYWVAASNSVGISDLSASDTGCLGLSAPAGVAASQGTYTNKVCLTWDTVAGAVNYLIYRNTVNNFHVPALATNGASPYDDSAAATGTNYYYWIKAANSVSTSDYGRPVIGYSSVAPVITAQPQSLTNNPGSSATFSVTATGTAPIYYQWQKSGVNIAGATVSSYTIGSVAKSDEGAYRCLVTNLCGSTLSSEANLMVIIVGTLAAPTGVSASDGTYTDKVAITWTVVSGASGYEIWRATANNSAAAVSLGNTTLSSYDDNSSAVRSAILFYYWVKARNSVTTSEFSHVDSGFCRLSEPNLITGQPVVGDYDGDGKADPTVYDLASGRLFVWLSSGGYVRVNPVTSFQVSVGDLPVTGDYDGDRLADPGVFNSTTGSWHIWLSSEGYDRVGPALFGLDANDIPIPADYDGDGKTDPAVYRASSGEWHAWLSSAGYIKVGPFTFQKSLVDIPVPGQFDIDHLADPAVYQQAGGAWYIWLSSADYTPLDPFTFHTTEDHIAVPADYDGDGLCDPAAYVPATGLWRIWLSGSGYALVEALLQ